MTKHFTFEVKDDGDTILRDGETFTHRMMMRDSKTLTPIEIADAATRAVMARDAATFAAARKPGFHYADSAVDSRAEARAAARQLSYDAYDREVTTAYLRKAPVVADAADPRTAWHDAHNANRTVVQHDGNDTRDAAYSQYDADLESAYKTCKSL